MSSHRKLILVEALVGLALAALAILFMVNKARAPSPSSSGSVHAADHTAGQEPAGSAGSVSTARPLPSGDIPDNAIFVVYRSRGGGYTLQYIEGWVVTELPRGGVTISDKDSSVNVRLEPLPGGNILAYVQQTDLPHLRQAVASFAPKNLGSVSVNGKPVAHLTFTGLSPPDPVTGKRRRVMSDRYYLAGSSKLAILTLTTPVGVDNVDAFNQILRSFSWR